MRGWLVVEVVVTASWEEDEDDCEPELTEAPPVDPEATRLELEDPDTFPDELLDTACDSTTDSLVVEVVGFVPGTPARPLVRVTFELVDDEED